MLLEEEQEQEVDEVKEVNQLLTTPEHETAEAEAEFNEAARYEEPLKRQQQQENQRQEIRFDEELEDEDLDTDLIGLLAINDVPSIAHILLSICETKEKTIKLLEALLYEVDPCYSAPSSHEKKKRALTYDEEDLDQHNKIARPEAQTVTTDQTQTQIQGQELEQGQSQEQQEGLRQAQGQEQGQGQGITDSFVDHIRDLYDDDACNESLTITLAVLIPNDMGLSAYIIGKHGANVAEIRRRTKARTQLEQPKVIPSGVTERNIFFMGTIRAVCEAYQHVYTRIVSKADTLPSGCLDDLRMVIPTELSALLIGKGGVNIKKIQAESGTRTHLQSEEEMMQRGHCYGRVILISGSLRQRCHAMLLILKNVSPLSLPPPAPLPPLSLSFSHDPLLFSLLLSPPLCSLKVIFSKGFPRGLEGWVAALDQSRHQHR
jgi:hypothetical protein